MEDVIRDLLDLIQTLSPKVWATLVQQAITTGVIDLLWSVVLGFAAYLSVFKSPLIPLHKIGYNDRTSGQDSTHLILLAVSTLLVNISAILLTEGVAHLLNPEYYALNYLLDFIGK